MKKDYCENCGVILQGNFCHACGQSIQSSSRFFGTILMELLDNLFSYDSRVYKTFVPLMIKPGNVCNEYLSGKRVSFLPPFRLYLFASIIFFLIVPLLNDISVSIDTADEQVLSLPQQELDSAAYIALNKDKNKVGVVGTKENLAEVDRGFPYFIEERETLRDKLNNITKYNSDELLKTSLNSLPTMMFFLLPLLALTLKLFYLFSKRFYAEHLIVVLYSQSFLFFMLLFTLIVEKTNELIMDTLPSFFLFHTIATTIVALLYLWIPVYIFLFLKKVYGQSTVITLAKFSAISVIYLTLIAATVTLTIVWGVFNL
jgi:hypothetical protein